MLILINSLKLDFEFSLGQPSQEVLDGLTEKFIENYGKDVYTRAGKIIVVEENFFNVIKDRYGPPLVGEHIDELQNHLESFLVV